MFSLLFITEQHIKFKIDYKCQKDLCIAFLMYQLVNSLFVPQIYY